MRPFEADLAVAASGVAAASSARNVVGKWVQVNGLAGGAAVQIEGHLDGTNYKALTDIITTDGMYQLEANGAADPPIGSIRTNRTTAGTGTPTVKLVGYYVGA